MIEDRTTTSHGGRVLVADAPEGPRVGAPLTGAPTTATATVVTPTDRVRWGPVIAGLLTALSTLVVLSVLGAAITASTYDGDDTARNYGIRAGLWGAISALIAFALGGWVAARTAAVRGRNNGVLNGAMVWVAAVPLLVYMVGTGISAAARAANSVAQTASQTAAAAAETPQGQDAAERQGEQVRQRVNEMVNQGQARANDPATRERAADAARKTAWGTLVSLILALGASTLGGWMGARDPHAADHDRRGRRATNT